MKPLIYQILATWAVIQLATPAAIRVEDRSDNRIQIIRANTNVITAADMQDSRAFHNKNGKVVEGRIMAYHPESETVTIRKKSGKPFNIDLDVLSEADQAHVREWHSLKNFFDPERLQISVKREKSTDGMELLIWKPTEEIVYEITLRNRCGRDLENLILRYHIWYDRLVPQDHKEDVIILGSGGELKVGTLADGKSIRLKTRPVTISVDDLYEYYKENEMPIAKLKGIKVKIFLPLDDNRKAMRELFHPSTLNQRNWLAPDPPVKPLN